MRIPRKKTSIIVLLFAGVLAICLFVTLSRAKARQNYNYIDLPIVLSNEAEVVQTIRDGMTVHNPKITITFTAKGEYSQELFTLADSLVKKAMAPTADPKQGDYIRFQYGGYQLRYSNPQNDAGTYDYTLKISPYYYTTIAREDAVDEAVQSFLTQAAFTRGTSDYERIKAAHDFLVSHCEYDWRNSNLSHRHIKSTAYGALVRGEASCQGYSVAMYRLLLESGVDCRVITGYATSPQTGIREYHAWNLVCLDGTWYNVDVSWDDQSASLDYFLKSDATFSSHERDAEYSEDAFTTSYPVSEVDYHG